MVYFCKNCVTVALGVSPSAICEQIANAIIGSGNTVVRSQQIAISMKLDREQDIRNSNHSLHTKSYAAILEYIGV